MDLCTYERVCLYVNVLQYILAFMQIYIHIDCVLHIVNPTCIHLREQQMNVCHYYMSYRATFC